MKKVLISCLMLLFCGIYATGQTVNNTAMVGTVTDPTGAVVVGAHVTAVEESSKVPYNSTTNAEGYYNITGGVLPGTYDVTVQQSGFAKTIAKGVIVTNNQVSRTDFSLKVANANGEEVTVSANTPAIQTDDSLLGETVSEQQVRDLPMNGRNALDLAATSSNVTVSSGSALTGVPPGKTASGAGTRGINNSITLDGISTMNSLITTVTLSPNPDALDAVQTQNGNYTAQYGDYLGVHINEVTKNGTNAFHGTAYDYIQNDAFNSRGFTHSSTIPTKTHFRYNLFGGVFDGPLWIPHVYNGRDKTFFMGSYEGLRQKQVTNTVNQTFSNLERTGDFSELVNTTINGQSNKQVLIFSPYDGHPYFNDPSGGIPTTQSIDDQKPANRTIVNNILTLVSPQNVTAPGTLLTQNSSVFTPSFVNEDSTVDRVDESIGEKVRLFARFDWQRVNSISYARDFSQNNYNPTSARNGAAGYTHSITPNLVNDLRVGYNWIVTNTLDYQYVNNIPDADAKMGIPGFNVGQSSHNYGVVDVSGPNSFNFGQSAGSNWIQDDRTYQLYDQVSWTKGKHSLMAGIDLRRLNIGRAAANDARGLVSFGSGQSTYTNTGNIPTDVQAHCKGTTNSLTQNCSYGYADASFYLGVTTNDQTPLFQIKEQINQWRDGFFVQDTWNFSKKLTLEYGLRWELPQVATSANGAGRILTADYSAFTPTCSATTAAAYNSTCLHPGFGFSQPNHKAFAPRLGFAYRVTDRVTLRGGGGIYYNANQTNAYTLTSTNFPLSTSSNFNSPSLVNYNASTNPYVELATPAPPTAGSVGCIPLSGVTCNSVAAYSVDAKLPPETMYQWNLDNGVELWKNAGLELQYLGSRTIHLNTNYYPNQPQPQVVNTSTYSVNALRPNQQVGQIRSASNRSNADYEGLTTVFRQRMSHGISGSLSYTWAHSMDESNNANSSGTCSWQDHCYIDWGNADNDVRHRAVLSFTWALPTLKQHNFAMQEAIGGWQVNGILTFQSGSPFNINFGSTDWAWAGVPQSSAGQRPNWAHPGSVHCTVGQLLAAPYNQNVSCLDASAYSLPTRFTYGNLHRNDLHGPGSFSNNLSLFKTFNVWENLKFQLRMEAFNALNHVNANNPGSTGFTITSPNANTFGTPAYLVGSMSPSSSVFGTDGAGGSRTMQVAGKIIF